MPDSQVTWSTGNLLNMTRDGKDYPHSFNGGGVVKTVGCEPAVLGKLFDAALPPVHLRATLLSSPRASNPLVSASLFRRIL